MLIDLGRNDVGRIAKTGSVVVKDKMIIERYSHVMHIVSSTSRQPSNPAPTTSMCCAPPSRPARCRAPRKIRAAGNHP